MPRIKHSSTVPRPGLIKAFINSDFSKLNKYNEISEFPNSTRDLSFSIKEYSELKNLYKKIDEFQSEILKENYIFDFFFNEKSKEIKIGYRFVFQSKTKTLTDQEIDIVLNDIIEISTSIKSISIPGISK